MIFVDYCQQFKLKNSVRYEPTRNAITSFDARSFFAEAPTKAMVLLLSSTFRIVSSELIKEVVHDMEKTLRSSFLLAPELQRRISSKDLIFVACEILGLLIHLPTPINFFAFVEIPSRAEKEALNTSPSPTGNTSVISMLHLFWYVW